MILPYIEYGDVIIDAANDKQLNKLQKIQNHCLRICLQANPRTNLKEKKTQSKCMFRLGDDDIESPYKKISRHI